MSSRPAPWTGITRTLKQFGTFFPGRDPREAAGEAYLYYRRGCLAASEERYDDALVFVDKALDVDPAHLPARLLAAQIYDRGLGLFDEAVAAYRKVIALAGYDSEDPYCAAARRALDALVQKQIEA
jgi:tetratricopeptide (TPR) repeat protein